MLVYRVEGKNGNGPYVFPGFLYGSPEDLDRHPLPENDGIDKGKMTEFHYFAFSNLQSLEDWFDPKARQYLRDKDFTVKVYDVPKQHVMVGKRQVVFDRDHSKLVETMDIVNYFRYY